MIGLEKELIDKNLARQIEQIRNCKIPLDRKGKKYVKISKKNSELVLKFLDECLVRGLSKNRLLGFTT